MFARKYSLLENRDWLYKQYVEEKLSSPAIAKILGCDSTNVTKWLRYHGIEVRDNKTARHLVPLQSFKYPQLNDRDWLYQKYIVEGLATDTIGQLIGAKTCNSVRQALIRFAIPVRDLRESLIHKRSSDGFILTEHTKQVIEGGLLGDATMGAFNPKSDISCPTFRRKNKFRDHVEFVTKELSVNLERVKPTRGQLNSKKFTYYLMETLSHSCLLPIFRAWYPESNDFVKTVPDDFKLTPISLLHWFLDDGTTSYRIRNEEEYSTGKWQQRTFSVRMTFCTESFTRDGNQYLSDQLRNFGIKSKVTPYCAGTGWRLKILSSSVADFFDVIGPCPVPSMAYKWKLA